MNEHNIQIVNNRGVFYIYLDNKLYCSCDNWNEVTEEMENIENEI